MKFGGLIGYRKRYYVDGKYKYCINVKGDDFNFSNLSVCGYDSEYSKLTIKPINDIKLKQFPTLLERNNRGDKNKVAFDEMNLWEEKIDEICYDTTYEKVELWMLCCDGLFDFENITKKDKKIFDMLTEMYLSEHY